MPHTCATTAPSPSDTHREISKHSYNYAVFFKKFNLHNYLQQMVDSSTEKRQSILNHIDKQGNNKMI